MGNKKEHLTEISCSFLHITFKRNRMVRQAGFEPTTLWFVARYSIQLSYWRTEKMNFARFTQSVQGFA